MRFQLLVVQAVVMALIVSLASMVSAAAEVPIVTQGRAAAVVVLADQTVPTTRYAADELVSHIKLATGVELPIVRESEIPPGDATRIYLGETQALAHEGIRTAGFRSDAYIIRVKEGRVFIAGREDMAADPMDFRTNYQSGTLYGVYEVLRRFIGVRWMWPGELGTYAPHQDSISLPTMDERAESKLGERYFRWGRVFRSINSNHPRLPFLPAQSRLGFSSLGMLNYARDMNVYMRRHRQGQSDMGRAQMGRGHIFGTWWPKYGKEHPAWFMMRPDGGRGPDPNRRSQSSTMEVTNPELQRFIVEEVWDGGDSIDLGEADIGDYSFSPEARAWDGQQPRPFEGRYSRVLPQPYVVSDRYARFWKTILELAKARNPNVTITTLLYVNYFPAPLMDIKLSDRILAQFVPWRAGHDYSWDMWFPEPENRLDWFRDQWTRWQETGITMQYRPNSQLAGYVLPYVDTWQAGEYFRFMYQHGMVGADLSGLSGQWAVQGIMLYMYLRLMEDPELPISVIRQEYLEGYGPAATDVGRYFDYWEQYQYTLRTQDKWAAWWAGTGAYPDDVFAQGEAILADAMDAVNDPATPEEFRQRVGILQKGLEHARLTSRFISTLYAAFDRKGNVADEKLVPEAWKLLNEVSRFRRTTEGAPYIANYLRAEVLEMSRRPELKKLLSLMGQDSSQTEPKK